MGNSTLPSSPDAELPSDLETTPEDLMAERPTLTTLRLQAAMSMNELAVKAHVSPSTIMDIERGARPRMATMRKIAAALGVKPQEIAWPGDPFSKLDPDEEEEPQS